MNLKPILAFWGRYYNLNIFSLEGLEGYWTEHERARLSKYSRSKYYFYSSKIAKKLAASKQEKESKGKKIFLTVTNWSVDNLIHALRMFGFRLRQFDGRAVKVTIEIDSQFD